MPRRTPPQQDPPQLAWYTTRAVVAPCDAPRFGFRALAAPGLESTDHDRELPLDPSPDWLLTAPLDCPGILEKVILLLVPAVTRQLPKSVAISRRRWGYVVWGVALGFVFIPEILAALPLTESQLPFPTISRMTGHLEYEHAEWEIFPTMLSVFVLYSLWRVPPRTTSGGRTAERIAARRTRG